MIYNNYAVLLNQFHNTTPCFKSTNKIPGRNIAWYNAKTPDGVYAHVCALKKEGATARVMALTEFLLKSKPSDKNLKKLTKQLVFRLNKMHLKGADAARRKKIQTLYKKIQTPAKAKFHGKHVKKHHHHVHAKKHPKLAPKVKHQLQPKKVPIKKGSPAILQAVTPIVHATAYQGGLFNFGNTCWMNAVIQAIARCHYFDTILNGPIHDTDSEEERLAYAHLQQALNTCVMALRSNLNPGNAQLNTCFHAIQEAFTFHQDVPAILAGGFDSQVALGDILDHIGTPLPGLTKTRTFYFSNGFHYEEANTNHDSRINLTANANNITTTDLLRAEYGVQPRDLPRLVAFGQDDIVVNALSDSAYVPEITLELQQAGRVFATLPHEEQLRLICEKIMQHDPQVTRVEVLQSTGVQDFITALPNEIQVHIGRQSVEQSAALHVPPVQQVNIEEYIDLGQFMQPAQLRQYRLSQIMMRPGVISNAGGGHYYLIQREGDNWISYDDEGVGHVASFNDIKAAVDSAGYNLIYTAC